MTTTCQHNILYSCVEEKERGHEQFVAEHALTYLLSVEIHFYTAKGLMKIEAGSIGFIRRNQLTKTVKVPAPDGTALESVNLFLTQDSLRVQSVI